MLSVGGDYHQISPAVECRSRIGTVLLRGLAMDGTTVERQKLIEAVSNLSDEALLELSAFLDYLHYKSTQRDVVHYKSTQRDVVCLAPIRTVIRREEEITFVRKVEESKQAPNNNAANFLVAVAGLGNSDQQDVSERDEEILRNEIDPVYGWSAKPSNSV